MLRSSALHLELNLNKLGEKLELELTLFSNLLRRKIYKYQYFSGQIISLDQIQNFLEPKFFCGPKFCEQTFYRRTEISYGTKTL